MMGHVVVGDGDGRGSMDGIHQSVIAVGERAVVHPNMASPEYGHPIPVWYRPPPVMVGGVPHIGVASLLAVVYVEAMNDNVGHVLDSNARPSRNVDAGASAVDGLERVHDQLFLQFDHHIPLENDPQWLLLDHCISQSARLRVHRVIVPWVCHHVNLPISSAYGMPPKPDWAVSQTLAVLFPIWVAPPAVVDGVTGSARQEPQVPPWSIDPPAATRLKKK